ncbi:hypothetical protein JCM30237_05810 [Halolamina litorea]|uniref:DUF7964 domain-containing protein n=1 Tax=Halolamina litorea TaxID=1515593 RepID=A0ABD6BR30_9EURY|nr:hypothetical protein [Halolamina litorea]
MVRECEACGEEFATLSRLRLHDCPEQEKEELLVGLSGEPDVDALPDRPLTEEEFQVLQNDERIGRVKEVLSAPGTGSKVISFIYEAEEMVFGMHSDHDTGDWIVTTRGGASEFERVEDRHDEWVSKDIERVTGGSVDMDNVGPVKDELTINCGLCGDEHVLKADPNKQMAEIGLMEYTGYCEGEGEPLVRTYSLDEVVKD